MLQIQDFYHDGSIGVTHDQCRLHHKSAFLSSNMTACVSLEFFVLVACIKENDVMFSVQTDENSISTTCTL